MSTAYYALFHLLIQEATGQMFGRGRRFEGYRNALARTFTHRSMAEACKSFRGGTLKQVILSSTGPLTIPPDLCDLARTFVKLQEARHTADYDRSRRYTRTEVVLLLQETDAAFQAWDRVRNEEIVRLFLMLLPLWSQLPKD